MAIRAGKFRDHDAPDESVNGILAGYFDSAAERLRDAIIAPPGKSASAQEWNQARASAIGAQVREIQKELRGKAAGWTGKALAGAMKQGTATAEQQAIDAGIRRIPEIKGNSDKIAIAGRGEYPDRHPVPFRCSPISPNRREAAS